MRFAAGARYVAFSPNKFDFVAFLGKTTGQVLSVVVVVGPMDRSGEAALSTDLAIKKGKIRHRRTEL